MIYHENTRSSLRGNTNTLTISDFVVESVNKDILIAVVSAQGINPNVSDVVLGTKPFTEQSENVNNGLGIWIYTIERPTTNDITATMTGDCNHLALTVHQMSGIGKDITGSHIKLSGSSGTMSAQVSSTEGNFVVDAVATYEVNQATTLDAERDVNTARVVTPDGNAFSYGSGVEEILSTGSISMNWTATGSIQYVHTLLEIV